MAPMSLIVFLLTGCVAGWLASLLMGGNGLVRYLITGVLGAYVGPILLSILGVEFWVVSGFVTQVLVAAVGAIVVILIARVIK